MRHNIALLGHGYWGKIVEKTIVSNPHFNLLRLYSPRLENEGIRTNDIESVWKDPSIDSVYIATPLLTHFMLAKTALKTGMHVLCEKPLTPHPEEAQILKTLSQERQRILETNYIYNHSLGVNKFRELLPRIGRIRHLSLSIRQWGRFYPESVYHVLASHLLSVLDMVQPINTIEFHFRDLITNGKGLCETGRIDFECGGFSGEIIVSLNSGERAREFKAYGDDGFLTWDPGRKETVVLQNLVRQLSEGIAGKRETYEFDETNNLTFVLNRFSDLIEGKGSDNQELAMRISRVLAGK
jgi:predicted dehydrogenase